MKECGHKARRDQESNFCHSCYMQRWREKNREKVRASQRKSYRKRKKENPEKVRWQQRASSIKSTYGLTVQEYRAYFPNGVVCELCGTEKKLRLDHCHVTGKIRGVLCNWCNIAIGHIAETDEKVSRLITYLQKY